MIHNWFFRSNFLLSLSSFQVKISMPRTLLSQAASTPLTTSVNVQRKEHCSADTSSWQAGARGSCCALQSGLKPLAILLPQLLKCWDLPVWVTTPALNSGSSSNRQGREPCLSTVLKWACMPPEQTEEHSRRPMSMVPGAALAGPTTPQGGY